jgi:5-methylcytosine-specific restriction endonuclease McrA
MLSCICGNVITEQPLGSGRRKIFCSVKCRSYRKLECEVCNKSYVGTRGSRFCSLGCKREGRKDKKVTLKICDQCNSMYESKKSDSKYCSRLCSGRARIQEPTISKTCPICDKEFKTFYKTAITCSIECQGKRYSLVHAKRKIIEKDCSNTRRKKRLKEQWVENVDLQVLIDKYNGICQLCNEPVDLTVSGNHNLYPSRDHIVPLNKGGLHSYENCQLAHRVCNSRKGDSIDADRNGEAICQ